MCFFHFVFISTWIIKFSTILQTSYRANLNMYSAIYTGKKKNYQKISHHKKYDMFTYRVLSQQYKKQEEHSFTYYSSKTFFVIRMEQENWFSSWPPITRLQIFSKSSHRLTLLPRKPNRKFYQTMSCKSFHTFWKLLTLQPTYNSSVFNRCSLKIC